MNNLKQDAVYILSYSVVTVSLWAYINRESSITCITRSENLGPKSTNVPYWNIRSGRIGRLIKDATETFYVRAIQDVK